MNNTAELRFSAFALRSQVIGNLIAGAMEKVWRMTMRALARHRRDRRVHAAYDDLQHLDDRMLRDLGFHRSEIAVDARFTDYWRGPA